MGLICKLLSHKWSGCKCKRCGEVRNEEHDWNGSKCDHCGRTRNKIYDYESKDPNKRISAIDYITSADLLFSIATTGEYEDIVEPAAIKLANLGDKRVITNFDEIARHGRFARNGSFGYNEFLIKIISIAKNIPCEETVAFLKNKYAPRNSYIAACAQKSLLAILEKVQSTPLAEQIESINLIRVC